jgi:hypothetical protein
MDQKFQENSQGKKYVDQGMEILRQRETMEKIQNDGLRESVESFCDKYD